MELFSGHRAPHHRSNYVAPNGDELELETTAIYAPAPAPRLSDYEGIHREDLLVVEDEAVNIGTAPDGAEFAYMDATPILAKLAREREEEQARLARTVTIEHLESISARRIAQDEAIMVDTLNGEPMIESTHDLAELIERAIVRYIMEVAR